MATDETERSVAIEGIGQVALSMGGVESEFFYSALDVSYSAIECPCIWGTALVKSATATVFPAATLKSWPKNTLFSVMDGRCYRIETKRGKTTLILDTTPKVYLLGERLAAFGRRKGLIILMVRVCNHDVEAVVIGFYGLTLTFRKAQVMRELMAELRDEGYRRALEPYAPSAK